MTAGPVPVRTRCGGRWTVTLKAQAALTALVALMALAGIASEPAAADTQLCPPSLEIECSLSAFGTLAYAISDNKASYLRFINDAGTVRTDSIAGGQLDLRFNSEWSLTFQGVVRPSQDRGTGWEPTLSWAFLSYRPNNDWLIRAGELRPPLFIYSQNMEVGVTYDQARLPQEFYALSNSYDILGTSVSKTWTLDGSEVTLEGYAGAQEQTWDIYDRGSDSQTYNYNDARVGGLVLSRSADDFLLRAGFHTGLVWRTDGNGLYYNSFEPVSLPYPSPLGGTIYYPEGPHHEVPFYIYTIGTDWTLDDWRVTSEFAVRSVPALDISSLSYGGYVTLARKVENWTPYITFAGLRSSNGQLQLFQELTSTLVPLLAQRAPFYLPASYHQTLASAIQVFDQASLMLGSSYSLNPTTKFKAEWMHTQVGVGSSLFDGIKPDSGVDIFTVSVSKTF